MEIFSVFFSLIKMVFSLFMAILKPLITILYHTGLWLFILIFTVIAFNYDFCKTLFFIPDLALILSFLYFVYKTTELLFRFFKKDSSFVLLNIFSKRGSMIDPIVKDFLCSEPNGFIFGKKKGKFAVKPQTVDGHILAIGGAGSGKSSCIAIPTLLSWKARVFAIDIKGELSEKSKNARHRVNIFSPDDESSLFGYDPFYILDSDYKNRVTNAREIVLALMPLPPNTKDPFWIEAGQNLLTGSILYYSGKGLNFIDTLTKVQSTPIRQVIESIMNDNDEDAKLFIAQYSTLDDKVLGSIVGTLSNVIMVFATDSTIKNALSKPNSITPDMLEKGQDIFIRISEHRLEQWRNLLTLMVSQFLKHFERRDENSNIEPVLFMLDEFARLGKIEPITNGLATLRSKKVTIAILTQSLAQLDLIYGKDQRQVIADNCSFKAILKATDANTQEYFSKLVGTYEKLKKSQSTSSKGFQIGGDTQGQSTTTEDKRIIKPEEFAYLEEIVLLTPKGFMKVDKAPYYIEKAFKSLV